MNNKAQQKVDIVAKVLAEENLTIIRANARTASFDVKGRVLTLPILKDGTSEIVEDMMMVHEVGHAKHSTAEKILEAKKTPPLDHYLNVVEDVRIEKLMKREYPGTRKSLSDGYKELNAMDFFGVKSSKKKMTDYNLIDRINLYFKVGHDCGVSFNQEEITFVERAERLETEQEALDLARDIFKYSKEVVQQQQQQPELKPGDTVIVKKGQNGQSGEPMKIPEGVNVIYEDDGEDDEGGEGDQEGQGQGSGEGEGEGQGSGQGEGEGNGSGEGEGVGDGSGEGEGEEKGAKASREEGEGGIGQGDKGISKHGSGGQSRLNASKFDYLECKTQETFDGMMNGLTNHREIHKYFQLNLRYPLDPVVGWKKVMEQTASLDSYVKNYRYDIDRLKADSKMAINYLLKEFELKKSAETHKRIMQAKTGSIDMRKIYAYKIQEDLFKRISVVPKGKNHGMVFLLDWSSSMSGTIEQAVRQAVELASFCRRAQIPFECYAFTSGYLYLDPNYTNGTWRHKAAQAANITPPKGMDYLPNNNGYFHLLQFLSSEMSNKDFNRMVDRLLLGSIGSISGSRAHTISGINGYTLGGTPLNEAIMWFVQHLEAFKKKHYLEKLTFITMTDGDGSALNCGTFTKGYVIDEKTKKKYPIVASGPTQTHMLLNIIRDRLDVTTVGFHIMDRESELSHAIANFGYGNSRPKELEKMRQQLKETGAAQIDSPSRDAMFVTTRQALGIKKEELKVDSNTNATTVAENLTKVMGARKLNRVVLERFISTIA